MVNKRTLLPAVVAVLSLVRVGLAQVTDVGSLSGEVHGSSVLLLSGAVTLTDLGSARILSADLQFDGSFEFRSIPCGQYRLSVVNDGRELYGEVVSVKEQNTPLLLQLSNAQPERPTGSTVSVNQLMNPPSKKALQAFMEARKLSDSGDHDKAAEELEKAVHLSTDFADAWVNLAAQHIHLHMYEQALQELSHACEVAKPTAMVMTNMAFAQSALKREAEAVQSVREAVRLDPSYAPAHYLLGFMLARNPRTLAEGIHHLEIAARTIPDAHATLELARRDYATAAEHK